MLRRLFVTVILLSPLVRPGCSPAEEPKVPERPRRIYLDEFRPHSPLVTPLHPLTRAKFPCVNVHFHPGQLTASEIDEAVKVMDDANIAVSVSLDGKAGPKFVDHYQTLTQRHPNRFVVFARMDYVGDGDSKDQSTWDVRQPGFGQRMADKLTESVRLGASGLKLLKELGLTIHDTDGKLIPPDDPRFDPIWERAGELGIPVIWHCSDPISFFQPIDEHNERWEELYRHPEWSFYGNGYPKHQDLIDARNRVIERHPKTTFICAHMADVPEDLAKLGSYLDKYPNMVLEIAARISELGRQPYSARDFFIRYQDRIMFGTDGVPPTTELIPHFQMLETRDEYFPYEDNPFPPQGFWNIYGLELPDVVLRQVYFETASRIIPGVRAAVAEYAKTHPEAAAQVKGGDQGPSKWLGDIRKFEAADRAQTITPGGIMFAGSSSIRFWDLEKSFPGKGYVNRGFGGCETSDVLHYARRIILPRKPSVVVIYAGDNDIANGKSPQQVANDFRDLAAIILKELPQTKILYLPIKPSTSRWKLILRQRASNALVESMCHDDPRLTYLDVANPVLGADGRPDPALLRDDGLHLNEAGYAKWNAIVGPAVLKASGKTSP